MRSADPCRVLCRDRLSYRSIVRTDNRTWDLCATCGIRVDTLHCPGCGEKALEARDLTFMGLMSQVFQSLSSLDSRLLRSLRVLIDAPRRHHRSVRERPAQALYRTVPAVSHRQRRVLRGAVVQRLSRSSPPRCTPTCTTRIGACSLERSCRDKLQAAHTTLAAYTPVFDHAVDVNAKSLVILLVLPFALLLIPLFAGSRRPFVTHLVFALHLLAFLLLCSCVLLLFTAAETALGGSGLRSPFVDWGAVRRAGRRDRDLFICRDRRRLRSDGPRLVRSRSRCLPSSSQRRCRAIDSWSSW